jgi:hypothetical protein
LWLCSVSTRNVLHQQQEARWRACSSRPQTISCAIVSGQTLCASLRKLRLARAHLILPRHNRHSRTTIVSDCHSSHLLHSMRSLCRHRIITMGSVAKDILCDRHFALSKRQLALLPLVQSDLQNAQKYSPAPNRDPKQRVTSHPSDPCTCGRRWERIPPKSGMAGSDGVGFASPIHPGGRFACVLRTLPQSRRCALPYETSCVLRRTAVRSLSMHCKQLLRHDIHVRNPLRCLICPPKVRPGCPAAL